MTKSMAQAQKRRETIAPRLGPFVLASIGALLASCGDDAAPAVDLEEPAPVAGRGAPGR